MNFFVSGGSQAGTLEADSGPPRPPGIPAHYGFDQEVELWMAPTAVQKAAAQRGLAAPLAERCCDSSWELWASREEKPPEDSGDGADGGAADGGAADGGDGPSVGGGFDDAAGRGGGSLAGGGASARAHGRYASRYEAHADGALGVGLHGGKV